MTTPVRLLLVDDHPFFRRSLRQFLEAQAGLVVLAEAEDGLQAVNTSADLGPDLVVMDVFMPVLDGVEAARAIKAARPQTRVVLYSGASAVPGAEEVADAFVPKEDLFGRLVPAIGQVLGERLTGKAQIPG